MQATVFSKSGWTFRLNVKSILPSDTKSFDMAAIKVLLQLHCWRRRRTLGLLLSALHFFHRRRSRGGPLPRKTALHVRRHDRIWHSMEEGALSHMDHSHHCKLMRVCRDWAPLLNDGMACSRSRALGLVLPVFQNSKANSSLAVLDLTNNRVGAAGAVALAEALKATVVTCSHELREDACVCFWRWKQNQSDVKS